MEHSKMILVIIIMMMVGFLTGQSQGQGTCDLAPKCGAVMAEMDGVPAYSNGPTDQCSGTGCAGEGTYGLQYECVELAQRYFAKRYDVKPYIWGGNANQLCSTHPSSVEKASGPAHGYLAVFNWAPYGHVAVINHTVDSGSSIQCLEQNNHPNGIGVYPVSEVMCYLKPVSSPPPPPPPPSGPSCAGLPDGWFCGDDGIAGGNPNSIYFCSGGEITQTEACGFTCVTMPHGQNDQCTATGSCTNAPTSYLCGNDHVGGSSTILYLCKDGHPSGATYCASGCEIVSGANDKCK